MIQGKIRGAAIGAMATAVVILSAIAFTAYGGAILVEKDFTLETGSQRGAAYPNAASMRLGYGPFSPIELGEFYVTKKDWGKVFPTSNKSELWDVEQNGGAITHKTKAGNPVKAVAAYTLLPNSVSMKLTIDVPAGTPTHHIIWDLFLSEPLFSGASITVDDAEKGTLSLDACPDKSHATIFKTVNKLTAKTKVGTWQFDLPPEGGTSWVLRGARDSWRPENLRTFTLIYDHAGDVPDGIKLNLSVDIKFTPVSDDVLEDIKAEKRVAFMENVLRRYGYPLSSAEMPTRLAERAEWLARKVCSVSANLNENGLDPAATILIPEPKIHKKGAGAFKPSTTLEIAASAAHEAAIEVLAEDLAPYGVKITRVEPCMNAPVVMGVAAIEPGIAKLCAEAAVNYKLLKPEGYAIAVTPERVLVAGADERGVLYGAQTLRQLIRNSNGKPEIPETLIIDWPDLRTRGYYIETGSLPSPDEMRHLIRNLYSFTKANALVFEIKWANWQWATHPEVSDIKKFKNGPTRPLEELRELAHYAKKYKIDFIPCVFTYGKVNALLESHPEIAEEPNYKKRGWDGGAYCPNKEETYKLIFDLMGEVINTTGCSAMHIGHDEIKGMAQCAVCKNIPPGDLFANDVNRIARWLAAKNVRTIIWGDMLLDATYWEQKSVSSAHSLSKEYGNLPVHLGLGKIDENVIIGDWHYKDSDKELPTFKHFVDAGHKVIGGPWYSDYNNYYTALKIKQHGGDGILVTDWGFLPTRSPLATSMLGLAYAWNLLSPCPEKLPYNPERVLAASTWRKDRPSRIAGVVCKPIGLSTVGNKQLRGGADAWFGLGGENDLSALPTGSLKLFGVDYLVGQTGVVAGEENKGQGMPAKSDTIIVNEKASSLVFLHAMTLDEPTADMKTYGAYRVTFASGKTVDVPINGGNIAHWLPQSIYKNPWGFKMTYRMDAVLAWQGCTLAGKEIGLHAYEWTNPFPEDLIASVDMSFEQGVPGLKIGLVALTAIKKGDGQ